MDQSEQGLISKCNQVILYADDWASIENQELLNHLVSKFSFIPSKTQGRYRLNFL